MKSVVDVSKKTDLPSWLEYFAVMREEERKIVAAWLVKQLHAKMTQAQKDFVIAVERALEEVDYDYAIPIIEPSQTSGGTLYYQEGEKVCTGLYANEWEHKAYAFAVEYQSEPAYYSHLVLWYAYRVASGEWSLEYLCDDSSGEGNYYDSPDSSHDIEVSGERIVGGAADGVGNTFKCVYDDESYLLVGGDCYGTGKSKPVAHAEPFYSAYEAKERATWVLVLKNPPL